MARPWWNRLFRDWSRPASQTRGGRRSRCRPQCEQLEDRTVPDANFDFEMLPRIVPDSAGRFVVPNTPDFVKPPDGFGVKFDASLTSDDNPATDQYEWTISDATGSPILNLHGLEPQTK